MDTRRIANIKVGKRHRKDMGKEEMAELAASIADVGLLHPIVIQKNGSLIAGERRLAACKTLGWKTIPVSIVNIKEIVRGEFAENTIRKDFTLSEAVAIKRAIEPEIKEQAKKQRGTRTDLGAKLAPSSKGKARDKVAKLTGKKRTSLAKAEAIVAAADAEPKNARIAKLVEDMDRTGNVNGPYKRLKVMGMSIAIRAEPPPLPGGGPYRVIVADPPWPYEIRQDDPSHRATHPYATMSISQICAMDINPMVHKDCILWLWTTNHHMHQAFTVLDAWGFENKTILTWAKDKMGMGDWLRGQTEHCLMAVRGKPIVELTNQTTLLHGPVRKNSQKPEEFYAFVEKLCPAPRYASLFSGTHKRENWDGHGLPHRELEDA